MTLCAVAQGVIKCDAGPRGKSLHSLRGEQGPHSEPRTETKPMRPTWTLEGWAS